MTDPAAPTRPRETTRLAWADVAKGACILLVVLHHATVKHYLPMVPDGLAPVARTWEELTEALKPVRMPLFFLLAGVFAAGAVRRPWSQVLTKRVLTPYWLYTVWLAIGGVVFTLEQDLVTNRVQDGGELVADLVFASTGAWFLYALAVYFVVARLTLRFDTRWVLGAAAVLAASVSALPMSAANRESVLMHLVYFLLGVRAPEVARRLADVRRPPLTLIATAYVAAVIALDATGAPLSAEVTLLSLLGVPLAIRLAAVATTSGRVSRGLGALGRNTLPVYVLHMPLLAALHHTPGLTIDVDGPVGTVLVVLYPLLATAVLAAASLGLHRLLVAAGLTWLFVLPASLRPSERSVTAVGRRLRRAAETARARSGLAPDAPLRLDQPSHRTAHLPAMR